jgi:predicted glycosyltransferase
MLSCTGMLCGAGFETPAEALFLKKKLMVIPMKGQYEQQCNAAALKEMGVPVIKSLKLKHLEKIVTWVNMSQQIPVDYSNDTEIILDEIIKKYKSKKTVPDIKIGKKIDSFKKLKSKSFGKILEGLSKG